MDRMISGRRSLWSSNPMLVCRRLVMEIARALESLSGVVGPRRSGSRRGDYASMNRLEFYLFPGVRVLVDRIDDSGWPRRQDVR